MNIENLIFDFDGTLVDSMFLWKNIGEFYLRSKNIKKFDIDINEKTKTMSFIECADFFQKKYLKNYTKKDIYFDLYYYIKNFYINNVKLKSGVKEFLHKNSNKKMCIASESKEELINLLLNHFNIKHYFNFIITSDKLNSTKKEPFIYNTCLIKLNANINNTILFEDSIYAINTANKIGLNTICILDQYSNQLKINSVKCLKIVRNFNEL